MQTIFNHYGYEMRSHSETRWASIMDVLRVTWLYEPRTITTKAGWYLPDFYLPSCGVFVEVKGPTPTAAEIQKAADVEAVTGCPVIFAHGDPVILHGELFHGLLTYYWSDGSASFSTAEIGELVRKQYDEHTYCEYLRAGQKKQRPDVVHMAEVVGEWLVKQMTREEIERAKREKHAPLNAEKVETIRQKSIAEWFVSEFARAVSARKDKDAA